jgi:4'-phosphopantetheinyl transferase
MASFELRPGEVHVWVTDLDAPAAAPAAYYSLLAADERERAERLRFEHLRVRFVTGRGILRQLLSRYLQVAPEQVAFRYGPYGKPGLAALPASAAPLAQRLAFNLAHSHNLAVYAMALAPRIGVDVEQVRQVHERDQIAERFFSPSERSALAALPAAQREEAFFLCWTRKEAYLKALGAGITYPLDRFSVSLIPGQPAALLEAADDGGSGAKGGEQPWTLLHFEPAPLYQAAVAIEGEGWVVRRWWWDI